MEPIYIRKFMNKSEYKRYKARKRGVYTINFPDFVPLEYKNHIFKFYEGNKYIIKGKNIENMILEFPNSVVISDGIDYRKCSIEAPGGTISMQNSTSIPSMIAESIEIRNCMDSNIESFPYSDKLYIYNSVMLNKDEKFTDDFHSKVMDTLVIENSKIEFPLSSNVRINPDQKAILIANNFLINNSILSSVKGNKSLYDYDGKETPMRSGFENHFSIEIYSINMIGINSKIESGYKLVLSSDNVELRNSTLGSIRDLECNIKFLYMDENSEIFSVKPLLMADIDLESFDIKPCSNDLLPQVCNFNVRKRYNGNNKFRYIESNILELEQLKSSLQQSISETKKRI